MRAVGVSLTRTISGSGSGFGCSGAVCRVLFTHCSPAPRVCFCCQSYLSSGTCRDLSLPLHTKQQSLFLLSSIRTNIPHARYIPQTNNKQPCVSLLSLLVPLALAWSTLPHPPFGKFSRLPQHSDLFAASSSPSCRHSTAISSPFYRHHANTLSSDKYTTALLTNNTAANQYTLLTLLVNTVGLGNFTGPGTTNPKLPGSIVSVPGILAPGVYNGEAVNLLPYFDGSLKSTNRNGTAVALNFLDGGGAAPIIANPLSSGTVGSNQYMLFTHLYQYFGALLGCSGYGTAGFPAYMGVQSQQVSTSSS